MKTKLIMLDNPIIVSDEKIRDLRTVNGRWHIEKQSIINQFPDYLTDLSECQLIIAGLPNLPSINWNGLEEEFGWIDVWKLAENRFSWMEYGNYQDHYIEGYIEGFKKAKELNEKKFSLEDMREAYNQGMKNQTIALEGKTYDRNFEVLTQSLQQPKVFDIEIETEYQDFTGRWYPVPSVAQMRNCSLRPKITNNQIKIIKKL